MGRLQDLGLPTGLCNPFPPYPPQGLGFRVIEHVLEAKGLERIMSWGSVGLVPCAVCAMRFGNLGSGILFGV